MTKFYITFNECYKHTVEPITKEIKGHYLSVGNANKLILIDNQTVAEWDRVNNIKFMCGKYWQSISINPLGKLLATDIEKPIRKGVK